MGQQPSFNILTLELLLPARSGQSVATNVRRWHAVTFSLLLPDNRGDLGNLVGQLRFGAIPNDLVQQRNPVNE